MTLTHCVMGQAMKKPWRFGSSRTRSAVANVYGYMKSQTGFAPKGKKTIPILSSVNAQRHAWDTMTSSWPCQRSLQTAREYYRYLEPGVQGEKGIPKEPSSKALVGWNRSKLEIVKLTDQGMTETHGQQDRLETI